jgi:two-component system, NtrC family, response regulator AtoC
LKALSPQAEKKLLDYSWPGNTRELANIIERAVVMDTSKYIEPELLYIEGAPPFPGADTHIPQLPPPAIVPSKLPVGITLQELEKRLIIETLQACHNNRTKTAETLGISIRTLRNKLHEYNLMPEKQQ